MGTLRRASDYDDRTGNAVRELLKTLEPHFEKEERVAMPVLGTLAELVSGEKIPDLREIADSQGGLLKEYKTMFEEHKVVGTFIEKAKAEAKRENHEEVAEILDALRHHARVEEEVLYPAALLAGIVAKVLLQREAQQAVD